MNILLTGIAGFIGSHLAERLIEDEHYIYGLDNLSNGSFDNMAKINKAAHCFIQGDIRRTLSDQIPQIDVIVHLAACGSVPRSMKDPTMYMQNNVLGFHNVLEFARRRHIKTVLYASSSSIYGNSQRFYRYESDIPEPLSPYAGSKRINEIMAQTYENAYWINCFGLRFFNVFGPRQKLNSEYAAVIPKFCEGIIKRGKIKIYGDGNQIRTFTPVDFVTECIAQMITQSDHLKSSIYNITHQDYAMSVNDTARLVGRVLDKPYTIEQLPERTGDVKSSIGHGNLISEETGVAHTQFSNLEAMQKTCAWYASQIANQ